MFTTEGRGHKHNKGGGGGGGLQGLEPLQFILEVAEPLHFEDRDTLIEQSATLMYANNTFSYIFK